MLQKKKFKSYYKNTYTVLFVEMITIFFLLFPFKCMGLPTSIALKIFIDLTHQENSLHPLWVLRKKNILLHYPLKVILASTYWNISGYYFLFHTPYQLLTFIDLIKP